MRQMLGEMLTAELRRWNWRALRLCGARRSSSENIALFTSRRSGVFSWTWICVGERSRQRLLGPKAGQQSFGGWRRQADRSPQDRRDRCDEVDCPGAALQGSDPRAQRRVPARAKVIAHARPMKSATDDCDVSPFANFPHSVSTLPSTPIDCPEMLTPASDSRKAIIVATSCGLVIRRSEMRSR